MHATCWLNVPGTNWIADVQPMTDFWEVVALMGVSCTSGKCFVLPVLHALPSSYCRGLSWKASILATTEQ